MRLLKCPSCGGPVDPPAGVSYMTCTYCGNAIEVPEGLRKPAQGQSAGSLFAGIDTNALLGYGAKWARVVELAQSGNKAEAMKSYSELTGQRPTEAQYVVDALAGSQSFEFVPGNADPWQQVYPAIAQAYASSANVARSAFRWIACIIALVIGLTVVLTALPVLIGVIGGIWAALSSF